MCVALALMLGSVEVAVMVAVKVTKGDDLGQYREFTLGEGTSNGVHQADQNLLLEHATRVDLLLVGGGGGGTSGGGGGGGAGLVEVQGVLLQPGLYTIRVGIGGAAGGDNKPGSDGAHTELLLDGNVIP